MCSFRGIVLRKGVQRDLVERSSVCAMMNNKRYAEPQAALLEME